MIFYDIVNFYTILISYSVQCTLLPGRSGGPQWGLLQISLPYDSLHDILYFKMNLYLYFMISYTLYNVHTILNFPFKSLLAYLEKILFNKI